MEEKIYTLIFVKTSEKVLLGYKKRGFGANRWNGYGGKVEQDEDIIDGAIRELREESNLHVCQKDIKYLGIVSYRDLSDNIQRIVYIFTTENVRGTPQETEEMKPRWFYNEDIPYLEMLPDAEYWLKHVLSDINLYAEFTYSNNKILAHNVQEPEELLPLPLVAHSIQGL